jgi:hypothetical protein
MYPLHATAETSETQMDDKLSLRILTFLHAQAREALFYIFWVILIFKLSQVMLDHLLTE